MSLTPSVLDSIEQVTALMKWRKGLHHVIYFMSAPERGDAQIVYLPNWEVAGSDWDIAIGIIEALLPAFGRQAPQPSAARPEYDSLGIGEDANAPPDFVKPLLDVNLLDNAMLFAAILRYRRSKYHVRYQADDGKGTPVGEYLEGTNFSSSMDMVLLASGIESLASHLGGRFQPPQGMPEWAGYGFYNEEIKAMAAAVATLEPLDLVNELDGDTLIAPPLRPMQTTLSPEQITKMDLVALASSIDQYLPSRPDLTPEELIAMARQIKPVMNQFLKLLDDLR